MANLKVRSGDKWINVGLYGEQEGFYESLRTVTITSVPDRQSFCRTNFAGSYLVDFFGKSEVDFAEGYYAYFTSGNLAGKYINIKLDAEYGVYLNPIELRSQVVAGDTFELCKPLQRVPSLDVIGYFTVNGNFPYTIVTGMGVSAEPAGYGHTINVGKYIESVIIFSSISDFNKQGDTDYPDVFYIYDNRSRTDKRSRIVSLMDNRFSNPIYGDNFDTPIYLTETEIKFNYIPEGNPQAHDGKYIRGGYYYVAFCREGNQW